MGDTGLAAALARARLIKTAAFEKEALNRAMKVFNKVGPEKWMKMLMKALRRTAHTQLPRLKARETALNKFTDKLNRLVQDREVAYRNAVKNQKKQVASKLRTLFQPEKTNQLYRNVKTTGTRLRSLDPIVEKTRTRQLQNKAFQDSMNLFAKGEPLLKPQVPSHSGTYTLSPQELDVLTRRTARYSRYLPGGGVTPGKRHPPVFSNW